MWVHWVVMVQGLSFVSFSLFLSKHVLGVICS